MKVVQRDGSAVVVEGPPPPAPNVWIQRPDGGWEPIGRVLSADLRTVTIHIDTKSFSDALAATARSFAGWTVSMDFASVAFDRLYELICGSPLFGPREIRRGQWASVALLLVGALLIALVALS